MGKMMADGGRFMVGGRGRLPLRTLARRGVPGPGLPERGASISGCRLAV